MKKIIQTGLVATLLVAAGCSDGNMGPTGGSGGGAGHGSGGAGGGAAGKGGAGGSGATGGSATGGAAGGLAGAAGGGAGAGGAAGGVAGAAGSSAGAGGAAGAAGGSGGAGGAAGGTGGTTPPLPPALVPPLGATLAVQYHGVGTQIYTCAASGGADAGADAGAVTYSWVFKAPDAKLYDSTSTQVGTHSAGPKWTSSDGSVVNGVKAESVTVDSTAIPWLLLRASSTTGTGVFQDVTYVQRLNTVGGLAPAASGCNSSTSGMDSAVNYTADYLFFKGGGAASWLNAPSGVPAAIAAPAGTTLAIHDKGIGTQVYTCTAGTGGAGGGGGGAGATTYSWVLLKPDAILYDATYTNVGTHGMGPEWTSTDGSVVNGSKVAGAGGNTTDIPWLLLKASSTTGTGVFTNVTYVQRLNTAGGQAPATGCSSGTVNTQTSVNYSADYYFYTGTPTDGGTGG